MTTPSTLAVLLAFCFQVNCLLGSHLLADDAKSLPPEFRRLVTSFCSDCHGGDNPAAKLDLEKLSEHAVTENLAAWEKVVKKINSGQMPPRDAPQPAKEELATALSTLVHVLDDHAANNLQPGRTATFRRLTRFEYQNAIRDLLALEIDATELLPADEASHGFDNITVGELSPTLVSRYLSAAQKIARLAVGRASALPDQRTVRVRPDVTQEERVAGLPLGTRGGVLISHTFPEDGEYEVRVRLTRDRNEHVEGLSTKHEMELLLDTEQVKSFTVAPPQGKPNPDDEWSKPTHENVDRHLKARFHASAGPHDIGVAFLKMPSSLLESKRQPLNVHFNMYRHPRLGPAVYQVTISGPFDPQGSSETPSRRQIFIRTPNAPEEEAECARQIVRNLMRRACRRPVTAADLQRPMALYQEMRQQGGDFDDGIEMALSSILVHPEFLFRVENDPADIAPGTAYAVDQFDLASRLSFFLWSSIPDDELLKWAEPGKLSDPVVLQEQVERMLKNERSQSLVTNFAGQWLYLRNLDSITPDGRGYPDFDDNLRQAFRQETELFVASILREDRSVLDLLSTDYTYLNERLAKHYGIPHVYGAQFRRVELGANSQRGGLLRHGSVLTVTSYATRTSPVIRGKWILENLLGTPPSPPPDNVPQLKENNVSARLPVRERLAQHRADPNCASCHDIIDPLGFSLENFDAVGRWRELEEGVSVDSTGMLPDGTRFDGVAGLEQALVERPEIFVGTLTEKLLTYALGRELTHHDAPAVRQIVREAAENDYRFSRLISGIVKSRPFQMRMSE
ncbi:MAG: DUF1592 domain-containing protein [Planctomycetaceae bacterium]|nr:DUF1592 domain-containing protein [Planctomycetaceae bacterium]